MNDNMINSAREVYRSASNYVSKRIDEVKNWAGHVVNRKQQPYTGGEAKVDSVQNHSQIDKLNVGISQPKPLAHANSEPKKLPMTPKQLNAKMIFPEDTVNIKNSQSSESKSSKPLPSMPPPKTSSTAPSEIAISGEDAVDSALPFIQTQFKVNQSIKNMNEVVESLNQKIRDNLNTVGGAALAEEVKYENGSLTCSFIVKHEDDQDRKVAERDIGNFLSRVEIKSAKTESTHRIDNRAQYDATLVTCKFDPYVERGFLLSDNEIVDGLNARFPDSGLQWKKTSDGKFESQHIAVPNNTFAAEKEQMRSNLREELGEGNDFVRIMSFPTKLSGNTEVWLSIDPYKASAILGNNLL